jgi:soluble lytic murein transglycosylase-like protein
MRKTGHNSAILTGSLPLLAALCLPGPARAAEHITLANGFDLTCNHHEVVDGKVRIYLKASEPDYFELNPADIAAYETVPDPVEFKPAPSALASANPASAIAPASTAVLEHAPEHLTAADLHQILSKPSAEHNVDEDLLASLIKAESGGHAHAVSSAGARGLMQLMPGTAHQLGVSDSFAPDQNVQGGTAYFDALLTRYHDNIALALAAYNAGPGAVDRYHGIPPYRETQLYVARVIHEFNRRVIARRNAARSNPVFAANQSAVAEQTISGNAGTGSD